MSETVTPEYIRARWSERSDVYDHVITHGDDVYRDLHRLADALESVQAERDAMQDQLGETVEAWNATCHERDKALERAEHLEQEARIHAQEARTQRATVNEIYQLCSGYTGEQGDWHGAEPVRRLAEDNRRLRQALFSAQRRFELLHAAGVHEANGVRTVVGAEECAAALTPQTDERMHRPSYWPHSPTCKSHQLLLTDPPQSQPCDCGADEQPKHGPCPDCGDTQAGGPACQGPCGALEPEEVRRRRERQRLNHTPGHGYQPVGDGRHPRNPPRRE